MAINRFLQSSVQSGLPKFDSVWDGRSAVGAMEPISAITLTGTQSIVEFNNIPQTYTHLQIRMIAKNGTTSGNETTILAQFNNDSTYTNYYGRHLLYGDGTSAAAAANNTSAYVGAFAGILDQQATANTFGVSVLDILDYTNTNKNKVTRSLCGTDRNGAGTIALGSGLWINTAAITSIKLVPLQNTLGQYSSFSLYGIK